MAKTTGRREWLSMVARGAAAATVGVLGQPRAARSDDGCGHPCIKHIVVLMMENRSFDHLLGLLMNEIPDLRGVRGGDWTNVDDKGLYFRTAPPDGLQAAALTDIIMRDGVRRIAIVARDDAYGKGLMDSVRDDLIGAGLSAADIKTVPYNTDEPEFESLGATMRSFAPEGVLIIGYDETAKALDSILKVGFTSRAI